MAAARPDPLCPEIDHDSCTYARVAHTCRRCRKVIPAGTHYIRFLLRGKTRKFHLVCYGR